MRWGGGTATSARRPAPFATGAILPVAGGDLDLWAYARGVVLDFSRPGKPTDNAFAESFNGKVRAECLNANWFLSLDDARRKCEAWRTEYNEVRPHSSIGQRAPIELATAPGRAPPP